MGGEGVYGIASGGGRLDRRALSDNRTFYQVELRANDHTCRGGIADLDGWGVSRLDYLGGYSRRLQLLYVYLKIGILGFGGGYAMLSLIQADVVDRYGWISLQEFTDIVAISQMTPGPIGINSATYIGYTAVHNAGYSETMSILGSCLTTFAVCLPSFLLVLLISYFFAKFRNNKYVEAAFLGLRPATVGLIAAAALLLMNKENFIDYKSFLIFGAAFILTWKFKVHPILMIILAGIAGIILYW